MELCEVRIPTYKRPRLLERALASLIEQDYPDWVALVMDDSPEQEARSIVAAFEDDRIQYRPNSTNLGCAGNIDQAFTPHGLIGGSYACILEDDNWLMPSFLSQNIASLKAHRVNVVLRNQAIWTQTQGVAQPTGRTTRGTWFRDRQYTPIELQAHLFYFEGLSNGGLFWRTSLRSNLQVGDQVSDSGLQEYCRTLQLNDCVYFESEPLCCWAEMPLSLSLRNAVADRVFGRGVQSIKGHLLQKNGEAIVQEATRIAQQVNQQHELESSLIDALFTNYAFQTLSHAEYATKYLKAYAKLKLVQDPLSGYFASINCHPHYPKAA